VNVLAQTIVGLVVVFMAQDPARGEDPKLDAGLEIEGRDYKEGKCVSRTRHTLKLAPNQLSSVTFDLAAIAEKKVRLTVTSKEDRPLTFRSIEIPAGDDARTISAQPSKNRLEVVGDQIYVYYDLPKSWWLLTAADAREEGRLQARVCPRVLFAQPNRGHVSELRARRITVTVTEQEDGLSQSVASDP
jgi:hypothetical protein